MQAFQKSYMGPQQDVDVTGNLQQLGIQCQRVKHYAAQGKHIFQRHKSHVLPVQL